MKGSRTYTECIDGVITVSVMSEKCIVIKSKPMAYMYHTKFRNNTNIYKETGNDENI